jgi:hypothetical protein
MPYNRGGAGGAVLSGGLRAPTAASMGGAYPPSSSAGAFPPRQSQGMATNAILFVVVIVAFIVVFAALFKKKQDDKRSCRRRTVRENGRPKDLVYARLEERENPRKSKSPVRSAAGYEGSPVYRDPGVGYAPREKVIPRQHADDDYDPYENADLYSDPINNLHRDSPYDNEPDYYHDSNEEEEEEEEAHQDQKSYDSYEEEEDDEGDSENEGENVKASMSKNQKQKKKSDKKTHVRLKPYRNSALFADKMKPTDATLPGMQTKWQHEADKHGTDPNKIDPCRSQDVAVTGLPYLEPSKQNYLGPGNYWGLKPKSDDFSLFKVPEEFGGGTQGSPDLPAKTNEATWKRKNMTPYEAMNRYRSRIHDKMEEQAEEMIGRLRSTVEKEDPSQMTEREKDTSSMSISKLRNRITGNNTLKWRKYMHEQMNGGLGLNEFFANMPYWERHNKLNSLVRAFAYKALREHHTDHVSLILAMNHKLGNQMSMTVADAVLRSLHDCHDINEQGRWVPKKGQEYNDIDECVARILPHGRACVGGEEHRNPGEKN